MILVSNDFPPKVGGIQNYLYELWSRLPLTHSRVITTKYRGASEFDARQTFDIERYAKILWPTPQLSSHVNKVVAELRSDVVFIDPLLPTGLIADKIDATKILIVHGAEVTVPGRVPISKPLVKKVVNSCDIIISAGNYAAREIVHAVDRPIDMVRIAPGVNTTMFVPPTQEQRELARHDLCEKLSIPASSRILMSASRLVPRKGFDTAISALTDLEDDIHLVITGTGRDEKRLLGLAEKKNVSHRVHLLGRVSLSTLISTYHASDVFLMLCRDRWGSLEAEGFGIVFLEAAACGLPVIVGRSGGSEEAVLDSRTGYVVDPKSVTDVRTRIRQILEDPALATDMGKAGRDFVERNHSYDYLSTLLLPLALGDFSSVTSFDG